MALPKATVQIQAPTAPHGTTSAPRSAPLQIQEEEEEEKAEDGVIKILSIIGFVAALVVLSFQLMTANTWISASDNPQTGNWSQLMD